MCMRKILEANGNWENLVDFANELGKDSKHPSETYDIVSKVGYLVGVGKKFFEMGETTLQLSTFDELQKIQPARIIRNLCLLRTSLELNYKRIKEEMKYDFKRLDTLSIGLLSEDCLTQLQNERLRIVEVNSSPNDYIIKTNKLICDRIANCKDLFPEWLNWDYLRKIFIMPKGTKKEGIMSAADKYYSNKKLYPYGVYINWHFSCDVGNILYNDDKFVTLLYEANHDTFTDTSKVKNVSSATKKEIDTFLAQSQKSIIVVDCENSDPFKLYAVLNNLNKKLLLNKINKIILCDDRNASTAWSILEKFTAIIVEHEYIDRLKSEKSLVDHKLIAKTSKEVYKNDVDSVILFSSDSDYWAMITELKKDAKFHIMLEREKCSHEIKITLEKAGVTYSYIDEFCTGNSYEIKSSAIMKEAKHRLESLCSINLNTLLQDVLKATYAKLKDGERKLFYNTLVKKLDVKVSENGDLHLTLKD